MDASVAEFLMTSRKPFATQLFYHLRVIADFPTQCATYETEDSVGRLIYANVYGEFAIHYWEDTADGHVKILSIEKRLGPS